VTHDGLTSLTLLPGLPKHLELQHLLDLISNDFTFFIFFQVLNSDLGVDLGDFL
jgi:hypothetical protein